MSLLYLFKLPSIKYVIPSKKVKQKIRRANIIRFLPLCDKYAFLYHNANIIISIIDDEKKSTYAK
jgi:hypothetical protein